MDLLIVVPDLSLLGGVASHYNGLAPYWTHKVTYVYYGKRRKWPALVTFLPDLLFYVFKLAFGKADVVVVNPSFRPYQIVRDGVYVVLARLFRKKVVTFFHGWDVNLAKRIENRHVLFATVFGECSFIYVLYSGFKNSLLKMGIACPICLTTTKIDDWMLDNMPTKTYKKKPRHLLFLSRILRTKGIFIALDTFKLLKQEFDDLEMKVCGDGEDLHAAKDYATTNGLDGVTFVGRVGGESLRRSYAWADIYLLPSFEEGMATTVLEAMGFGLPVITRPVGGVVDFIVCGEMGELVPTFAPHDFAEAIRPYLLNPQKTAEVGKHNREYAQTHFRASAVCSKFEKDLDTHCR